MVALAAVGAWFSAWAIEGPLPLGERAEMLLSYSQVASSSGITLRLNPLQPRETVLVFDQPWEGPLSSYATVLEADGVIRLYYRGWRDEARSDDQVTCLAESDDGIHFRRPHLGLVEYEGSTSNNILVKGSLAHALTPFLDTNPDANPESRYKAVAPRFQPGRLYALGSPDGIRWSLLADQPVTTNGAFDSQNVAFWDSVAGQYCLYSRALVNGWRSIQRSTSLDFLSWSQPAPNLYNPNPGPEHLYTSAAQPCPGAEQFHVAFPMRLVESRRKVPEHPRKPGVSDVPFMSSRNRIAWDRTLAEPCIVPGLGNTNWTYGGVIPGVGILELTPGEFSIYVCERFWWEGSGVRRYTVRKHGFASLRAEFAGGEFTTHPFRLEGNYLLVNYRTSARGVVRVELLGEDGVVLPGYGADDCIAPLFGNEIDGVASWRTQGSDLSGLRGSLLRLRFVVQEAEVYAFRSVGTLEGVLPPARLGIDPAAVDRPPAVSVQGVQGMRYALESAPDLGSWQFWRQGIITSATGDVQFPIDSFQSGEIRFFRATVRY